MAAKLKVDWDKVEPLYVGGVLTVREIAEQFNTTSGRVCQVALKRGWERDLSEKIRIKTQSKLSKTILSTEKSRSLASSERQAVEAIAQTNVTVILRHRTEITRFQSLCDSLLSELEAQALSQDDLLHIAELKASLEGNLDPEAAQKNLTALRRLLKLDERADTFKKLVEAKTRLVALERQCFGIKDGEESKDKGNTTFILNMAPGSTTQVAVLDGQPKLPDPNLNQS
jgi:hypothetical protein